MLTSALIHISMQRENRYRVRGRYENTTTNAFVAARSIAYTVQIMKSPDGTYIEYVYIPYFKLKYLVMNIATYDTTARGGRGIGGAGFNVPDWKSGA